MEIMSAILATVQIACLVMLVHCAITFWRVREVGEYLRKILDQIHTACLSDIQAGRNYHWRYEVYETVTFEQMVRRFWQKVDTFYPNKSFLDPDAVYEPTITTIGGDAK